jgi:hypothetical protein
MFLVALGGLPIILLLPTFANHAAPATVAAQMLPHAIHIGVCVGCGALAGTVAILCRRYRPAFAALTGAVLVSTIPISGILAAFSRYVSLGPLVMPVRSMILPGDVVVHRFVRDDNSELPFYLRRPVRILKRPGEYHQPILGEAGQYYIEEAEFARLWQSEQPVFLMYSQPAFPAQRAEPLPPDATVLAREMDACICCNASAARRLAARQDP